MRRTIASLLWSLAAAVALVPTLSRSGLAETDLQTAIPAEVYMAVYAKHNPERDYQREYLKDAWETAREERIGERIVKLITARVPDEKLEQARSAWEKVREAVEPINVKALGNAEEFIFAQKFAGPFNQQLLAFRLTEEDADGCEQGVKQLFELFAEWSEGKVNVETSDVGDVEITTLRLPKESPFQPSAAQVGDVFLFSSSPELLRTSVGQLAGGSGKSKFDDPRFKEAMKHLPKPEDVVVFFDGQTLWKDLGGIGDFIREKAANDEDAQRVAKLMDRIVEEISILDYEITVEYTEDGQNRAVALGKLTDDAEEKLLGKALTQGKPFDDWKSWVPAEAKSVWMTTGLNLHVLYDGILDIVREHFPKSEEGLQKFAEVQEEIGVDLDEDILQSFSGECVSVRLVIEGDNGKESTQGVTALKCDNPERIRELLDRAFENLKELPAVAAQNFETVDAEGLDGFREIRANVLVMSGARPVIGFHDGWMIISSHIDAAKKLLAVREGEAESIADSDLLEDFDVDADGEVYAVKYSNIGDGVRAAADGIEKAGMMLPMFLGMAAAEASEEDREAIMEAIGLLPSIAKVVRKFDFYEDRLSITQQGPIEDSYIRRTATNIRQPGETEGEVPAETEVETVEE
ncbi:MAG TPA: hypothetical protein VF175_01355 [Lacipirellula sp.]